MRQIEKVRYQGKVMLKKLAVVILVLLAAASMTGCTAAEANDIGRIKLLVDANDHTIINVAEPVNGDDAATKDYIDEAIAAVEVENPVYWEEMCVPVNAVLLAGDNDPTWTTNVNGYVLLFMSGGMKEVFFILEIPHAYLEGTDIAFNVHYAFASNDIGHSVRWGLEYQWRNIGVNMGSTSTIYCNTPLTNNDALDHFVVDFPDISGAGKAISSMLICRLFRDATDPSDDYGNNVYLMSIDARYQTDGRGSIGETSK